MDGDTRLCFTAPADGSARLIFGDAEGGGAQLGASLAIDAGLGGMRVYTSAVRTRARARVQAGFADDFTGQPRIAWDANVSRVDELKVHALWQEGIPRTGCAAARWQGDAAASARAASLWQDGAPRASDTDARWQDAEGLRNRTASLWQEGIHRATSKATPWQDSPHLRARRASLWQEGIPIVNASASRWAEMLLPRQHIASFWQEGIPLMLLRHFHHAAGGDGIHVRVGSSSKWQEMRRPPPGQSQLPDDDDEIICYDPETLGRLVFWQPYEAPLARLVFVCEYSGGWWPPAPQPALVTVPVLRSYIVVNELAIIRARDGMPIVCDAFSMSLDADSWTWSWQGSIPLAELPKITPGKDGNEPYDPVGVLVTLNGCTFHLLAESWTRAREFAKARINVRGRGRNALLDSPYAYASLHHNDGYPATAQQLMAQALLINGVSSGWSLDFQLADWQVPAGTWNFTGAPISAVLDVAQATAAMVLPHRTEQVLRVLPRYSVAPWLWQTEAQPHFELPAAVVQTEGVEWQTLPDYDRAFISGTTADGITAQVTRAGQPGDIVKPMVTHPLITAEAPARARGIAELAQAGKLATVTLNLPVLHETGVIEPGHMVRYKDALQEAPFIGAVRSVQVQWSRPVLRQSITLETHDYEGAA